MIIRYAVKRKGMYKTTQPKVFSNFESAALYMSKKSAERMAEIHNGKVVKVEIKEVDE